VNRQEAKHTVVKEQQLHSVGARNHYYALGYDLTDNLPQHNIITILTSYWNSWMNELMNEYDLSNAVTETVAGALYRN